MSSTSQSTSAGPLPLKGGVTLRERCVAWIRAWDPEYVHESNTVTMNLGLWRNRPDRPTQADVEAYLAWCSGGIGPEEAQRIEAGLKKTLDKVVEFAGVSTVPACNSQ